MNNSLANRDVKTQILDIAQSTMGSRGFSAVGLNEILKAAQVPKGSFYHYFESKEAFGVALLERYFSRYLAELDVLLGATDDGSAISRLMRYWQRWVDTQAGNDLQSRCLVVKLGAEVSDLSDSMRQVLEDGTDRVIERLTRELKRARQNGEMAADGDASELAASLYQMWLGASMLAKVTQDDRPLQSALSTTRRLLGRD
ncbi:TetR/AcrR family transcriptional regulator [Salinicola sp. V024]|jgi:TetR/AcrR family transcriptional repressor of nem operon|uniref:TetR/AcrR family transcriptional regulator n=1 Tax=Salinicola sp. V024 TaxID=3459609 RepID=UPI002EB4A880|nr:TetR/AcrR family transcriptional regulator [Pseudomonadota bacterium]MED5501679.1 TetR/AcrR family transcriptional regulator [Pseudomonadota bacterium]